MYQVTVQEKPARPWASLVGAAGALALALGLALYVTANKRNLPPVELDEPMQLVRWGATIRLPRNWVHVLSERSGPVTRDLFVEQTTGGRPRQMELRRIIGNVYRPPSYYMVAARLIRLLDFTPLDLQRQPIVEPATFGPISGFSVRTLTFAARVGVAPDGNLYIAQISGPTGVRRADIAVLDACVDSLSFADRRAHGGATAFDAGQVGRRTLSGRVAM
jgi:hypothetical protein